MLHNADDRDAAVLAGPATYRFSPNSVSTPPVSRRAPRTGTYQLKVSQHEPVGPGRGHVRGARSSLNVGKSLTKL
jgi:hypothetical protein